MAQISPIRRPLGALSSNTAPSPAAHISSQKTKSPIKSVQVLEATPYTTRIGKAQEAVAHQRSVMADKRQSPDDSYGSWSNKRRKMSIAIDTEDEHQEPQSSGQTEQECPPSSQVEDRNELVSHLTSPSPAGSPASSADEESIGSPTIANDSQNTTITVPDEDITAQWRISPQPRTTSRPLSTDDIRQKAKDMRLRLSLANYKVRTNQIDVPISRLQIRPSILSRSAHDITTSSTNRLLSRTPLPSATIPNISVQRESSEKKPQPHLRILSSPPANLSPELLSLSPVKQSDSLTGSGRAGGAAGLSTPLLPRQREAMLNPPSLGSPGDGMTSSVVKGHAVDGLLSLMRQG